MVKRTYICVLMCSLMGCAATSGGSPFEGDPAPAPETVEPDFASDLNGEEEIMGVDLAVSASDVTSQPHRGGRLFTLRGEAGKGLWDIMEEAGHSLTRQRGLEYIYTRYTACVTNRRAALCQVFSSRSGDVDGFVFAVHGARFSSAASEIFGAIAAANGESTATPSVSHGEFLCEKNSADVWCGLRGDETGGPTEVELSISGLGDLGDDFVYEGWLITPDGPVSTGRFRMSSDSGSGAFTIDATRSADATMFVLTIEPARGDDPAPADTHVVAGVFDEDGIAQLTTLHPAALATDFSEANGGYILETPSTASVADDYAQGVWFINPGSGAGLDLPALPAGWAYEGWVVGPDGPVSTGTFLATDAADSDGAGPAAGPDGAPPFPGQDFISPAASVAGATIVISVEPSPDNSPAPFFIKPLVDMTAEDVGPAMFQAMGNNSAATAVEGMAALR